MVLVGGNPYPNEYTREMEQVSMRKLYFLDLFMIRKH